jgi:hypothetical protein
MHHSGRHQARELGFELGDAPLQLGHVVGGLRRCGGVRALRRGGGVCALRRCGERRALRRCGEVCALRR